MRLVRFRIAATERVGIQVEQGIIDVAQRLPDAPGKMPFRMFHRCQKLDGAKLVVCGAALLELF